MATNDNATPNGETSSSEKLAIPLASESGLQCQTLDSSYIEACASVMAQAFGRDSPSYAFLYQEMSQEERIAALEWLFLKNLKFMATKCPSALKGIVDVENNNTVVCCFLWTPNPFHKTTTLEALGAGLWQMPFRYGFTTYFRIINTMDGFKEISIQTYDRPEARADPDKYIMLERMVVHPDYQGKGYGSMALKQLLEQDTDMDVRLSTQQLRTKIFYERLGFESLGDRLFPATKEGEQEEPDKFQFRTWNMIRRKRTTSSE